MLEIDFSGATHSFPTHLSKVTHTYTPRDVSFSLHNDPMLPTEHENYVDADMTAEVEV